MLQATLRGLASVATPASVVAARSAMRLSSAFGARKLNSTAGPAAAAAQSETSHKVSDTGEECAQVVLDRAELEAEMLDVEMDRDEGPEFAVFEGLHNPRAQHDPLDTLGRPCDLEFEFDRDDPEAVDQEELQNPRPKRGPEEPREHGVGAGERPQYHHGRDTGPKYEDTV